MIASVFYVYRMEFIYISPSYINLYSELALGATVTDQYKIADIV